MTKILAADLLICDVMVTLAEHPELQPLIAGYNSAHPEHPITPGSKSPLLPDEFSVWQKAVGQGGRYVAGGSAANTLSALKQLGGDKLSIDFIGAYGDDAYGKIVDAALAQDGFHVIPGVQKVETAASFVLVDARGERSILGYPGTVREKIRTLLPPEKIPADYDILFLPGSLWQKYGEDYAEALYRHALSHHKTLWLSLPTHSKLGGGHNGAIREVLPQAQVVLANAEELTRMFGCVQFADALNEVQRTIGAKHVAFITDGGRGAYVVTREQRLHFPPAPIDDSAIKSTLGAGDAAFAGFLFGWMQKSPYDVCANQAMKLAAEKMQQEGARITLRS